MEKGNANMAELTRNLSILIIFANNPNYYVLFGVNVTLLLNAALSSE